MKSCNDVTFIPSLLLVSRFCTTPEVKFDAFGTRKIAIEKVFLLYLSVHWGGLIEQIKKNCHVHEHLRLVFTSDGVVVGVVIRRVERYELVKIKSTESEAKH